MLHPRMRKAEADHLEGVWRWSSGRSSGRDLQGTGAEEAATADARGGGAGVTKVLVRVSGAHLGDR